MKTLYASLIVVVAGSSVAWSVGRSTRRDFLVEWAPNLAVEALSILVTIAVVQRLLDRQEKSQAARRRRVVHDRLSGALESIGEAMVYEHADTHVEQFEPINSRDVREIARHWGEGLTSADRPVSFMADELTDAVGLAAETIHEHRTRDADILGHDLIAAMDVWERSFEITTMALRISDERSDVEPKRSDRRRAGFHMLATGTVELAGALQADTGVAPKVGPHAAEHAFQWNELRAGRRDRLSD